MSESENPTPAGESAPTEAGSPPGEVGGSTGKVPTTRTMVGIPTKPSEAGTEAGEASAPEADPVGGAEALKTEGSEGSRKDAGEPGAGVKFEKGGDYRQGRSSEPEIPPKTLNATRTVFVPWAGLEARVDAVRRSASSTRVVVVTGARGSGRFTASVWMALRFQSGTVRPKVVVPAEVPSSGMELLEWVRSGERQDDTVYILRDPLRSEVLREWLTDDRLNYINVRMDRLQSWLILTVGTGAEEPVLASQEVKTVEVPPATGPLLKETLVRLWRWLWESEPGWGLGEPQGRLWEGVVGVVGDVGFTRVPQLVRFLWRLPQRVARGLPEHRDQLEAELRSLARLVTGDVTQAWFAGLSSNARFLALLVEALSGLQRAEIEKIYCDEALKLSGSRGLITDPRRHSFEDLYREINVQVVDRLVIREEGKGRGRRKKREGRTMEKLEVQYLEFAEGAYRDEVRRQMRGRHHLLWDVLISLGSSRLDQLLGPTQWEERQAFGEAIARFGGHRLEDLRGVMEDMGRQDSGIVSSIPGYVMRGLCQVPDPNLGFVERVLGDWALDRELSWASVAAIWRIHSTAYLRLAEASVGGTVHSDFSGFLDRIEGILTAVAGRYLGKNPPAEDRDHVAYAVGNMFRTAPARAVTMLRQWLAGEGSLRSAGVRAARFILAEHSDGRQLSESGFQEALGLVEPLLFLGLEPAEQKQMVDELLERLEAWIHHDESQPDRIREGIAWGRRIENALLMACNRAQDGERYRIRRALVGEWLRSIDPRVRGIAQRVITRARLLEGTPVEAPGHLRAALLVDSSAAGSVNHTSKRLLVELAEYLYPQVDLQVGHLGHVDLLAEPGAHVDFGLLVSRQESPRILMPWVERLEREASRHHFILVVHWDELVDLADADPAARIPLHCLPVPVVHEDDHEAPLQEAVRAAVELGHQSLADLFGVLARHRKDEVREQNRERSEWMFQWVGFCVDATMSQVLALRTRQDWGEAIGRSMPEIASAWSNPADRLRLLTNALEEWVAGAQSTESDRNDSWADPLRKALVLVQAMAAEDLKGTINRLCDWMESDQRDPRGNFAMAAGIMLLRIHFARLVPLRSGVEPSVPAAADYDTLLGLGPSLAARRSESGLRVLLLAVRCWLGDSAWAQRVREGSEMVATSDAMGPVLRAEVASHLVDLVSEPITAVGESKVPSAALAWASRFRFCLASEPVVLEQPLARILFIVHATRDPGSRGRLGRIAWAIHSRCEELDSRGHGLGTVAFVRAGCRHPVAVSREGMGKEVEDAFLSVAERMGIVGPALERFGRASGSVFLLADGPLHDVEDVMGTSDVAVATVMGGARRCELFWDNGQLSAPTLSPGWTCLNLIESEKEAVETLWNRLVTVVKSALP